MTQMVEAAHSLGLKAGFYANNCKCRDTCNDDACFIQDVKATVAWGFDSIKLDGTFSFLMTLLLYGVV